MVMTGLAGFTKAESVRREGRSIHTIEDDLSEKVYIAERPPVLVRPLDNSETEPVIG